jgi:hypothetical protein
MGEYLELGGRTFVILGRVKPNTHRLDVHRLGRWATGELGNTVWFVVFPVSYLLLSVGVGFIADIKKSSFKRLGLEVSTNLLA